MSSQALYRKWRPHHWDQVIGQEHITLTLRNAVRSDRVGHAYLFAGPRGTGKTTTARLLAKAMNCLAENPADRPCDQCANCVAVNEGRFLDLIEIDAASNTSVDDVRDLRDKINFAPTQGRVKVYIIDEVHMLSTAAFNALLKTLEEPPPHVRFILATTEVHKIPATVLSRCQRYEFRRVGVNEIAGLLRQRCAEEKLDVSEDALQLIARQATGSLRDAISLLDQLASTGERVTLEQAQVVLGTATSLAVVAVVEAVLDRDAAAGLDKIQAALDGGSDPRQFARQVVDYLRSLLMVRLNNAGQVSATKEARDQMARLAARFDTPRLLDVIRLFNAAASDTRLSWQPGLGLELALAEAVEERAPAAARAEAPAVKAAPPVKTLPADALYQTRPASQDAPPARTETREPVHPAENSPTRTEPKSSAKVEEKAPAKPETPSTTGEVGLPEIRASWAKIHAELKKIDRPTEALLNSCRSLEFKDGTLILVYQHDLIRKKMQAEESLAHLRQVIQTVLGAAVNVRCVISDSKSEAGGGGDAVEGDGMVRAAQELGGKIVFKE